MKCFMGTAALVFTLTTSQHILEFTPNHIWGASLWGPVFYFVIICISLRLFLSDEKYQVCSSMRHFQNQLPSGSVLTPTSLSVCHTSDIFRIYIFLQHITNCPIAVKMESFWCVWNDNVNISLFGVSGYCLDQSEFTDHQFVYFKPFTALCLSCDF